MLNDTVKSAPVESTVVFRASTEVPGSLWESRSPRAGGSRRCLSLISLNEAEAKLLDVATGKEVRLKRSSFTTLYRLAKDAAAPVAAGDVVMAAMLVTPAIARSWLERRSPAGYNRDVRESHVRALAEEIVGDRFKCTPQGLIFTSDGNLADGQHRLHAIAAANRSVWTRICYHPGSSVASEVRHATPPPDACSDDVSGPLDCGMPRPAYVIRGLQGNREFGREKRIQAIVHALDMFRGDERPKVSPGHIDAVVARYKGGIEWAADALQHNIPVVGAAALAIAWQRKSTRPKVEEFAGIVADRAFHNDPTRTAFMGYEEMRSGASRRAGPKRDQIARVLRCIAAFCEGKNLKRINPKFVNETYFTKVA